MLCTCEEPILFTSSCSKDMECKDEETSQDKMSQADVPSCKSLQLCHEWQWCCKFQDETSTF